jgi:hypothetical protein
LIGCLADSCQLLLNISQFFAQLQTSSCSFKSKRVVDLAEPILGVVQTKIKAKIKIKSKLKIRSKLKSNQSVCQAYLPEAAPLDFFCLCLSLHSKAATTSGALAR